MTTPEAGRVEVLAKVLRQEYLEWRKTAEADIPQGLIEKMARAALTTQAETIRRHEEQIEELTRISAGLRQQCEDNRETIRTLQNEADEYHQKLCVEIDRVKSARETIRQLEANYAACQAALRDMDEAEAERVAEIDAFRETIRRLEGELAYERRLQEGLTEDSRHQVERIVAEKQRAEAAEGLLAKERAAHADQRTLNQQLLIQVSALKSMAPLTLTPRPATGEGA